MKAEQDAIPHADPLALFERWYAEARENEPNDSNAMALATATPDGMPSVRMVLLKGHGPEGFTFYTNARSRKGRALMARARRMGSSIRSGGQASRSRLGTGSLRRKDLRR